MKCIKLLISLITACILINAYPALAATQVFTGNYQLDLPFYRTIPQEISINVAQDSVVYLDFFSECSTLDDSFIQFQTSWGEDIIYDDESWGTKASNIMQPYGPFPLKAGDYLVTLSCGRETFTAGATVGYSLTVSTTTPNLEYAFDPEPDSSEDDPINLYTTRSFEGSLGYGGYIGLKDSFREFGPDTHDYFYFNLPEGATYQVKVEYDDTFTDTYGAEDDLDLKLSVDNNGIFTAHLMTSSGYITPEYTVGPGWGEIRIFMTAAVFPTPEYYFPADGYGGYKFTVIVNGDEAPNAEIETILDISTEYWDEDSRQFKTIGDLLPGWESVINISITNHGSSRIAAKLAHGLSIDGGPVKWVGFDELSLSGGVTNVYRTTLITPNDTPYSRNAKLVTVLYDSNNNVLDTYQKSVDVWNLDIRLALTFLIPILLDPSYHDKTPSPNK